MDPILIGRKKAAELLGVCTRSLDNMVKNGLISPRRLGRRVLFRPEELKRFVDQDGKKQ